MQSQTASLPQPGALALRSTIVALMLFRRRSPR
jgi:hypothetical protein